MLNRMWLYFTADRNDRREDGKILCVRRNNHHTLVVLYSKRGQDLQHVRLLHVQGGEIAHVRRVIVNMAIAALSLVVPDVLLVLRSTRATTRTICDGIRFPGKTSASPTVPPSS